MMYLEGNFERHRNTITSTAIRPIERIYQDFGQTTAGGHPRHEDIRNTAQVAVHANPDMRDLKSCKLHNRGQGDLDTGYPVYRKSATRFGNGTRPLHVVLQVELEHLEHLVDRGRHILVENQIPTNLLYWSFSCGAAELDYPIYQTDELRPECPKAKLKFSPPVKRRFHTLLLSKQRGRL